MSKRVKKIIVNGLTFSRVLGTLLMPIFYTYLNSYTFLVVVGLLLLTDFFDGKFAKYWGVRTLFGSLLDMLADKLLALAILIIVGIMYPLMFIPFILEILIMCINIYSTHLGATPKSSQIGRIKMWILGASLFVLLFLSLNDVLVNVKFFEFIFNNIIPIKYIFIGGAIFIEIIVFCDYFIIMLKNIKNEKKSKIKFSDIKENKEFIKSILFDEEYYIKTIDMSLIQKVVPNQFN